MTKNKSILENLLILIILILIILILYKLFTANKYIDGFNVIINQPQIFGNYINSNTSISNTNTNILNVELRDTYRIETIIINDRFTSNAICNISYNNGGIKYNLPQYTIVNTNTSHSLQNILNTLGNKVYTKNIQFDFLNANNTPLTITNSNRIEIYGMKLGDYDKDYYTNDSINQNYSSTSSVLPKENTLDNTKYNHYFEISHSNNEIENKLIKGLNYKLLSNPTQQIKLTINYKNTLSNTIYTLSNNNGTAYEFYLNNQYGTIYFSVPILAKILILQTDNNIIFQTSQPTITTTNVSAAQSTNVFGKIPDNIEINTYSIPEYIRKKIYNTNCPSIDIIASNQNLTQKLCDDLENQDKIRIEKIKLDKEKQYLIKLKKQDEEINNIQSQINSIEKQRKSKDSILDNLKMAQYQKQKEEAVQIRDASNEHILNQKHLNFDVNLINEI